MYYFHGDVAASQAVEKYTPYLKPDDLLVITVSALDVQSTLPFNQVNPYNINNTSNETLTTGNPRLVSYLIDENGNIDFPVLGKIKLAGLTRSQAIDLMRQKLSQYIKNPTVNINLINFRVTILGEVNRPGTYTISNEKISLPEVLGLAGDLTIFGMRKDIVVIREIEGVKKFYHVDLTSSQSVFDSPVYYLDQSDIVYVSPNGAKRNSSQYGPFTSVLVSVAGIVISVISLLTR
ncbi:MAG: polysaccharide biosynthesis/export family protein [Flavobacteriaceae bacterium]|jgi:polysaccharide export outer membrane protein|nr:polysaccharide biosynthesis/export family protein [Flavobacteriaceae bacterium]